MRSARYCTIAATVRGSLPVYPYEQTSAASVGMSQKCQQATSFDQFSCLYEERVRYGDAKGSCGLEIYHEKELGRLQDRQVGGLSPLEDSPDINPGLTGCFHAIGAVTDEAAGTGEHARFVDRRNLMAGCLSGELIIHR